MLDMMKSSVLTILWGTGQVDAENRYEQEHPQNNDAR
jgi:hypothetical protein